MHNVPAALVRLAYWTLGVAAAAILMWLGMGLLIAVPAVAATPVPMGAVHLTSGRTAPTKLAEDAVPELPIGEWQDDKTAETADDPANDQADDPATETAEASADEMASVAVSTPTRGTASQSDREPTRRARPATSAGRQRAATPVRTSRSSVPETRLSYLPPAPRRRPAALSSGPIRPGIGPLLRLAVHPPGSPDPGKEPRFRDASDSGDSTARPDEEEGSAGQPPPQHDGEADLLPDIRALDLARDQLDGLQPRIQQLIEVEIDAGTVDPETVETATVDAEIEAARAQAAELADSALGTAPLRDPAGDRLRPRIEALVDQAVAELSALGNTPDARPGRLMDWVQDLVELAQGTAARTATDRPAIPDLDRIGELVELAQAAIPDRGADAGGWVQTSGAEASVGRALQIAERVSRAALHGAGRPDDLGADIRAIIADYCRDSALCASAGNQPAPAAPPLSPRRDGSGATLPGQFSPGGSGGGTGPGGRLAAVVELVADYLLGGADRRDRSAQPSLERWSAASPRGPPRAWRNSTSLTADSWLADDSATTGEPESQTDRVLSGRVAIRHGEAALQRDKRAVAAGTLDPAVYEQHRKDHQALVDRVDADSAELSPRRAALVDEVVAGHGELRKSEEALAAERKLVDAGKGDRAAHAEHVREFDAKKDRVYEATDRLRRATGRDRAAADGALNRWRDPGGSEAGCSASGSFTECTAASGDGETVDRDRCLALAGVSAGCAVTTSAKDTAASANCVLEGAEQGCGSSVTSGANTATAWCATGTTDCAQHSQATVDAAGFTCRTGDATCRGSTTSPAGGPITGTSGSTTSAAATCTKRCLLAGSSAAFAATADCQTADGTCDGHSTGAVRNPADTVAATDDPRQASSSMSCTVTSGGCATTSAAVLGDAWGERGTSDAQAVVQCFDGSVGCTGKGATSTNGKTTEQPVIHTAATDSAAADPATVEPAATDPAGQDALRSVPRGRETNGSANCEITAGTCQATSSSQASSPATSNQLDVSRAAFTQAGDPTGASYSSVLVDCSGGSVGCTGAGASATAATATGDRAAPGTAAATSKTSTGSANCAATAGACQAHSNSGIQPAPAASTLRRRAATSGPAGVSPESTNPDSVSVSTAGAMLDCSGWLGRCAGTVGSSATGSDGAVDGGRSRSSTGAADCEVDGGGCQAQTESVGSSAPDATRALAAGRETGSALATGPSSVSTASATLDCPTGCTGTVNSSASGSDGAVDGGRSRSSSGTGGCEVDGGACRAQSSSTASSGPEARLAGSDNRPSPAAAPGLAPAGPIEGPSSFSTAGATLDCAGQPSCAGHVGSGASGSDGTVDGGQERGSSGSGRCAVSGGRCHAQTVSVGSSGPDAALALPNDQEQPPVTPPGTGGAAGTAPVPGASSVSNSSATLDCSAGWAGCTGTTGSGSGATDRPTFQHNPLSGRGPPSPSAGDSSSTGACFTYQSECHAESSSSAASGAGVDWLIARNRAAAAQAAAQADPAANPDPTSNPEQAPAEQAAAEQAPASPGQAPAAPAPAALPATMSQSNATAACLGGGPCAAATQVDSVTAASATPTAGSESPATSTSTATGHCATSAVGCAVSSGAIAATQPEAGRTAGAGGEAQSIPGTSGVTEASASLQCPPGGGCIGQVTGDSIAAASPAGGSPAAIDATRAARAGAPAAPATARAEPDPVNVSHSTGTTSCSPGQGACQAGITTGATAASTPNGAGRSGTTTAHASAACQSAAGPCPTRTSGTSTATDNPSTLGHPGTGAPGTATKIVGTAECSAAGECQSGTGGFVAEHAAEVTAGCAGTGCRTHIEGAATHGANTAHTLSNCTAGAGGNGGAGGGWCAGSAAVGTSSEHAMAAAACQGSEGSGCSYRYRAHSAASAGGGAARGSATGTGQGTVGGGQAITTAAAAAGPGFAQASASCVGTPGTSCSHSYSARASASDSHPSGSWARASASGSGGGGMGGGGVGVSAFAVAGDGFGHAGATCSGAANCSTSYSAHAEAHDKLIAPVGTYTADAWATCSGGGSAGGGCGAYAIAVAGPNGVAKGFCSGGGACDHGERQDFIPAAPIDTNGTGLAVGPDGKPIPIEKMGPQAQGVTAERDANGNPVLKIKPKGGPVQIYSCPAPCSEPLHKEGPGGEKVGFDPKTGFSGSIPPEPGSDRRDSATGADGIGVARDENGNGEAWVRGKGEITDGRTGNKFTYRHDAPSDEQVNNVRLSSPKGSPVTSTCNGGCDWTSPTGEHLTVDGSWGQIQAQDANGSPSKIKFIGQGKFTNAAGDIVTADGAGPNGGVTDITGRSTFGPGSYSVRNQTGSIAFTNAKGEYKITNVGRESTDQIRATTPNPDGRGGYLYCEGDCTATRPFAQSDVALPSTSCKNCRVQEQLATGEGMFPNGWGTVELLGEGNDGPISRYTPEGDKQSCLGRGCSFTQFNRDANGTGGGAICTVGARGSGGCYGYNPAGDIQNCNGAGCRTGLLYRSTPEAKHAGRYCAGPGCSGSGPNEMPIPPKESNAAMVAVLDPDLKISEQSAKELAAITGKDGKPLLGRDPADRRPLSQSEYDQLKAHDPATLTAYNRELGLPDRSDLDRASMSILEASTTQTELLPDYQKVEPKIDELASLTEQALNGDNRIDRAEWSKIKPVRDEIERTAPGLLERWAPAQNLLTSMKYASWTMPEITAANQAVGGNRELVATLVDGYDPASGPPTKAQQDKAMETVSTTQRNLGNAQLALHSAVGSRSQALNDRALRFNEAYERMKGQGLNPAEALWLNGELAEMNKEQAALADIARPLQANVDAAKAPLRKLDLAYADASGNPQWASDLHAANTRFERISGLHDRLSTATQPRQQELATTFGKLEMLTELNYNAVRDRPLLSPKNYEGGPIGPGQSLVGGTSLPSSGLPDVTMMHRSAMNKPDWDGYDGHLKDFIRNQMSADERAAAAVYLTPQQLENQHRPQRIDGSRESVLDELEGTEDPPGAADKVMSRIRELGGEDAEVDVIRMLYKQPKDGDKGGDYVPVTLFRVKQDDGSYRYIDATGAHYSDLGDFRRHNEMLAEDGTLVAPKDLSIEAVDENGKLVGSGVEPKSTELTSESGHYTPGWKKALDIGVGVVTFVGAAAMFVGGTIVAFTGVGVPVAAAMYTIGGYMVTAGLVYFAGNAVNNIHQRNVHGQSNGWSNPAARADYITLGTSALLGVGAVLRPVALSARTATARTAAGVGATGANVLALGAFGYQTYDAQTLYNAHKGDMSPAQRADARMGLYFSYAMLAMGGGTALVRWIRPVPMAAPWSRAARGTALRPENQTSVNRPLIDRIDEVTARGGRYTVAELAEHLGTSEAQVRSALRTAPPGAGGRARYRMTPAEHGGQSVQRLGKSAPPTSAPRSSRTTQSTRTDGRPTARPKVADETRGAETSTKPANAGQGDPATNGGPAGSRPATEQRLDQDSAPRPAERGAVEEPGARGELTAGGSDNGQPSQPAAAVAADGPGAVRPPAEGGTSSIPGEPTGNLVGAQPGRSPPPAAGGATDPTTARASTPQPTNAAAGASQSRPGTGAPHDQHAPPPVPDQPAPPPGHPGDKGLPVSSTSSTANGSRGKNSDKTGAGAGPKPRTGPATTPESSPARDESGSLAADQPHSKRGTGTDPPPAEGSPNAAATGEQAGTRGEGSRSTNGADAEQASAPKTSEQPTTEQNLLRELRAGLDRLADLEPAPTGPVDLPAPLHGGQRVIGEVQVKPGVTVTRTENVSPAAARARRIAEIDARLAEIDAQPAGAQNRGGPGVDKTIAQVQAELAGVRARLEKFDRLHQIEGRLAELRTDPALRYGSEAAGQVQSLKTELHGLRTELGLAQRGLRQNVAEPKPEPNALALRPPGEWNTPPLPFATRLGKAFFRKLGPIGLLIVTRVLFPHPAMPEAIFTGKAPVTIAVEATAGSTPRVAELRGSPAAGERTVTGAAAVPERGGQPVTSESARPGSAPVHNPAGAHPLPLFTSALPGGSQPGSPLNAVFSLLGQPMWHWNVVRPEMMSGRMHLGVFGRSSSPAEQQVPPNVDPREWARYSPARRADTWQEAADEARRMADSAEVQVREFEDRAREFADQARHVQARADEPAVPELAQRRAELTARVARLDRLRDEAESQARSWRAVDRHADLVRSSADAADAYAALHRGVAEQTRRGRRQLAEIATYRAEGTTANEVAALARHNRIIHWLRLGGAPAAVLDQLARLASIGPSGRDELLAVMTAGLAGERADLALTRISDRNRLGWTEETRRALLAALPRTSRAWWRATSEPRNAAWRYKLRQRQRVRSWAVLGVLAAGTTALVGGFAVLGAANSVPLLAGVTAVVVGAAIVARLDHARRARAPPLARFTGRAAPATSLFIGMVLTGASAIAMTLAGAGIAVGLIALDALRRMATPTGVAVPRRRLRHAVTAMMMLAVIGGPALLGGFTSSAQVPLAGVPARTVAVAPIQPAASVAGTGRELTAARFDRAGAVARGLGISFAELNAANGYRFSGPGERIGGQRVLAPADWSGIWVTLDGDSYWRIYVERFADPTGYRRAVSADASPDLIHPSDLYRVQAAPAGEPSRPGTPVEPTPTPTPTRPSPTPTQPTLPPPPTQQPPGTPPPSTATPSTAPSPPAPSTPSSAPTPTDAGPPPIRGPPAGWARLALILGGAVAVAAVARIGVRAAGRNRATTRAERQLAGYDHGFQPRRRHRLPGSAIGPHRDLVVAIGQLGQPLTDALSAVRAGWRRSQLVRVALDERRLWAGWLVQQLRAGVPADQLDERAAAALALPPVEVRAIGLGSRGRLVPPPGFEFLPVGPQELLAEVEALVGRLRARLDEVNTEVASAHAAVSALLGGPVRTASAAGLSDRRIGGSLGVPAGLVASITGNPPSPAKVGRTAGWAGERMVRIRQRSLRPVPAGPGRFGALWWLRGLVSRAGDRVAGPAAELGRAYRTRSTVLMEYGARRGWVGWAAQQVRQRSGHAGSGRADAATVAALAGSLELLPEEVAAAMLDAHIVDAGPRGPPGVGAGLSRAELTAELAGATSARRRYLAEANEQLAAADAAYSAALTAYRDEVAAAVVRAGELGLSAAAMARAIGWPTDQVRALLGDATFEPVREERLAWTDRVWIRAVLGLRGGWLSATRRSRLVADVPDSAVAPSEWIATTLRTPVQQRRFWDSHLHHIGYPYQRYVKLAGFVQMMLDAGHSGVYTVHPIPQRIRGLAYYGDIDAIVAARFGQQMLGMRGKLTDAHLFLAHRLMPAHLRWHLVPGMSGGRFDIDGIAEYVMATMIMNPGQAFLIAESTLHKENVTLQLGAQGAHILDPRYQPTLGLLERAARELHAAFADGRLDRAEFPDLAAVLTGVTARNVVARLEELGSPQRAGELGEALRRIGALNAEDASAYQITGVHSRGLREFLHGLQITGGVGVIHNDAGEPAIRSDGFQQADEPDRRYLNALLAVLGEHPDARVIQAHVGTGKFTTLSLEYLRFLEATVLRPQQHGAYPNLYFDVSWNDLAQHIKADPAIEREFVRLVVTYPGRFVFGTDVVKAVSVAHYLRHATEMEPIFNQIAAAGGETVLQQLLYGNLQALLGSARWDNTAWTAATIRSGAWDAVLAGFRPVDQQRVRDWVELAELYIPLSHRAHARTPTVVGPRAEPFAHNPQLDDMRRWYNRITSASSKGSNTDLRWAAFRTVISDAWRGWRRPSRRATAPSPVPTPADGVLGLRDRDGHGYTWEALISGDQARRAGMSLAEQATARQLAQRRQLELDRHGAEVAVNDARTSRAFRLWLTGASVATVVIGGTLIVAGAAVLPWLSAVAFVARGAATLIRTGDLTRVRVIHESGLERGQVSTAKVVWLYRMALHNARHYGITDNPALAELTTVTRQGLADLRVLLTTPLDRARGETGRERHNLIVARYSEWFDRANRALGPTITSLQSTGPQAPFGRALHAVVAATFMLNAAYHLHQTYTAVATGSGWFVAATYGLYTLADVLLGMQALPTAVSGWLKFNAGTWPWVRKMINLAAYPAVTVANAGLTVLLLAEAHPLAAAAAGTLTMIAAYLSAKVVGSAILTAATGYLTGQGINTELSLGTRESRKLPTATTAFAASLLALGLLTMPGVDLGDTSLALPLVSAGVGWAAVKIARKLIRWSPLRARAPPNPLAAVRNWLQRAAGRIDQRRQARHELAEFARAADTRQAAERARVDQAAAELSQAGDTLRTVRAGLFAQGQAWRIHPDRLAGRLGIPADELAALRAAAPARPGLRGRLDALTARALARHRLNQLDAALTPYREAVHRAEQHATEARAHAAAVADQDRHGHHAAIARALVAGLRPATISRISKAPASRARLLRRVRPRPLGDR